MILYNKKPNEADFRDILRNEIPQNFEKYEGKHGPST